MKNREMERFIHVEGGDIFEKNGSDGHTVISCIPHAGNWEILARIRPLFKKVEHFGSMYRRLSNPLLEDFVYRSRTRYGCEMYSKEEGLREVLKLARSGGLLGVLSDQFTGEGLYIPYFGKVTGVTPLPALLYKRCKGKGHLHAVFTRNTSLGHWDAVLGRAIDLPEGCDSLAGITMQVNLALEKCQRENILDGFWMHHRWKSRKRFVPNLDDDSRAAIARYAKLPFRMILNTPDSMEEAQELTALAHALPTCRPDAELTILCPSSQADYWSKIPGVSHVALTDGKISIAEQFDAEEIYSKGPFDIAFMFGANRRIMRALHSLGPIFTIGWNDHPLARHFEARYRRRPGRIGYPKAEEYAEAMKIESRWII